ncbi:MAG: alkaline phosphatase [Dehalococcoidia bacterium]|nr:alkaline phosphatase [Dehalococcoidia bacterium]
MRRTALWLSILALLAGITLADIGGAPSPSVAEAARRPKTPTPTRTPTPIPTPTPVPTATPIPTPTPVPTSTPIPTPTPVPTSTPIPTPTPTPGPTIDIVAAGDIACDPVNGSYNDGNGTDVACRQKYTSDLLVGLNLAAVLTLGDNQYENGALSKFQDVYDPTWGRMKSITKPAVGNHEYGTAGADGYFDYFGEVAGLPTQGYYSFDLGGWHFISLNSNCTPVGGCGAGSPQEQWLRADLAGHPTQCTLAFWHHPRFSSFNHGSDATYTAFWQALYDANADIVLSGHDHNYERFAPQTPTGGLDAARGIREFVVGTGGRSHYGIGTIKPNSEVRDGDTFGVLKLTLGATSYTWQFLPEAGKTFTDSGTGNCH